MNPGHKGGDQQPGRQEPIPRCHSRPQTLMALINLQASRMSHQTACCRWFWFRCYWKASYSSGRKGSARPSSGIDTAQFTSSESARAWTMMA